MQHRLEPAPSVLDSYRGRHLLVTGFTGFLGKVWVGHLLMELPDVRITLVVRGADGPAAARRVRKLFERSPGLRPLRERHGARLLEFLRARIDVVQGDCREPLLGLSPAALSRLTSSVDAVVHVAGLTDFAPDPLDALAVNTRGAGHAADVAARTKGRRFVHVSTCFVAGMVSGEIPETIESGVSPNGTRFDVDAELLAIESACRASDSRMGNPKLPEAKRARTDLAQKRAQVLGWPNVYTYSKGLGEQVLARRDDIRLTIVRPSVVECATTFPFTGWNEGLNTSGPLVWMCAGYTWKVPIRADNVFDVVPVDSVARGTTLAVADALTDRAAPVYQLGSSDHNPLTFARALDLVALKVRTGWQPTGVSRLERTLLAHLDSTALDHGADRSLLVPAAQKATKWLRDRLFSFDAERTLPFLGPEAKQRVALEAQKAGMKMNVTHKTLRSVENMWKLYQPFIHDHDYIFRTDVVRARTAELSEDERARFGWDVGELCWRHYWLEVEVPGLDRWSLPVLRNEPVPEDVGFDLAGDLEDIGREAASPRPSASLEGPAE